MQIQKTNSPNFTGMIKFKNGTHVKWNDILSVVDSGTHTFITYTRHTLRTPDEGRTYYLDSGAVEAKLSGSHSKKIAQAEKVGKIVDLPA